MGGNEKTKITTTRNAKDIRKIKIEHKEHGYKITKLEYKQGEIEERLERIGWYILIYQLF